MMLMVTRVRFTPAARRHHRYGILGWVRIDIAGALQIDGVALRRTREGRMTLSYPRRRDAWDAMHPVVRPLDDATRIDIERQVFALLAEDEAIQRGVWS